MGMDTKPTIKPAIAKLIKRMWGRFRSFRLENMKIVKAFPTIMRNATIPKHILQKMFQESNSIIFNRHECVYWIVWLEIEKKNQLFSLMTM